MKKDAIELIQELHERLEIGDWQEILEALRDHYILSYLQITDREAQEAHELLYDVDEKDFNRHMSRGGTAANFDW